MELIDRNALKKAIGSYVVDDAKLSFNQLYENEDLLKVFDIVNAMPKVDAEPVRHGRWIGYPKCLGYEGAISSEDIVCSACGEVFNIIDNDTERFDYCPHCGARMDL